RHVRDVLQARLPPPSPDIPDTRLPGVPLQVFHMAPHSAVRDAHFPSARALRTFGGEQPEQLQSAWFHPRPAEFPLRFHNHRAHSCTNGPPGKRSTRARYILRSRRNTGHQKLQLPVERAGTPICFSPTAPLPWNTLWHVGLESRLL